MKRPPRARHHDDICPQCKGTYGKHENMCRHTRWDGHKIIRCHEPKMVDGASWCLIHYPTPHDA